LENCKNIGFIKTYSSDNYITDSAAGATAFSTGKKTYNGAIGLDKDGKPLKTILEMAEEKGLSTGLVATSKITHATPASFIAHQPNREMYEAIAADFLNTDIDVFIGGGKKEFESREDGRNLLEELKKNKYQIVDDVSKLARVKKGKLAALLNDDHMPNVKGINNQPGRGDMLQKATKTALNILGKNKDGFFLMIEGSQIDWGGHSNLAWYVVDEMLDFDKSIGQVLKFAAKDGETLVIITADHETGGFSLTDGNLSTGAIEGSFTTTQHTGVMVPVFAFGPGAKEFIGIYENTAIFDKMIKALGL
jgi:alkaline phosphatase